MNEKLLQQFLDSNVQKTLGKTINAKPEEISKLTEIAIPTLLAGLGRNSSTDEGARLLLDALTQHEDKDVSNLEKALKSVDKEDGSKIIGHIFGSETEKIQSNLAKESGLAANQVSDILNQLAPLLMGALGQEKKAGKLDSSSLSKILLSLVGSGSSSGVLDIVIDLFTGGSDNALTDLVGNLLGGKKDSKKTTKKPIKKATKKDSGDLLDTFLKLLK
jgi:hypothetical protein